MKKLILSLSIAAALTASAGNVFGDGDRVEELEARIAELEALVQQLLNQPAPAAGPTAAEVEAAAAAAAAAKVDTMLAEHKAAEAEAEHNHSYKFGGYVKTDVIYSDYSAGSSSGAGRDFYIPGTIPVGPKDADGESYTDLHAKESRINFKSTHVLGNGAKLGTFVEMDFLLSGQGDERVSNSFAPRLRHAFFTYNNWLFGQTWMTFFNVGALPENLDFVGPAESTIFGRQAMVRYTMGGFQFALENPETTITPFEGKECDDEGENCVSKYVSDDNRVPDLVARYNMSGDWGSFTVAGILRELRCDGCQAGVDKNLMIDDSTSGYGVSLSGKFNVFGGDDFRWMASFGSGMGRYLGLNLADGAVVDANGDLEAIDSWGVFGSYRHLWNDKWRSNFTLGYTEVDNDVALTGSGKTSEASSVHVNLIYSPQPKLDFGVELMYANREVENGNDGDMTRLQFSAKYAY
jgi:hypothetical protein